MTPNPQDNLRSLHFSTFKTPGPLSGPERDRRNCSVCDWAGYLPTTLEVAVTVLLFATFVALQLMMPPLA